MGVTGDACIGCPGGRGIASSGVVGATESCDEVNPAGGAFGTRPAFAHDGAHDCALPWVMDCWFLQGCPLPFPVVLSCIVELKETYVCSSRSKIAGLCLRLKGAMVYNYVQRYACRGQLNNKRKLLENGFELALWLSFRLLRISNGKCLLYRRTDLLTRSTDLC